MVAVILAFSVVPVFAAEGDNPSPSATIGFNVNISGNYNGSGSFVTEQQDDGTHVFLTAHNKEGYRFKYWVIDGEYVIVKGSLNSPELEILVKSDINAEPIYEKIGATVPGETTAPPVSQNTNPVSPETGADPTFMIFFGIGVLFVAIGGAVSYKVIRSK